MRIALAGVLITVAGCAAHEPVNPSLPIRPAEARAALREMKRSPRPLERPVVVLGGYLDPMGAWWLAEKVRRWTGDATVLDVEFFFCGSFEECRSGLIEAVDAAFPGEDPHWTTEVDVIALSMGGLVARHAAAPAPEDSPKKRRLRIARLFTISTPHRGADLADLPSFHSLHVDMRADSEFITRLNEDYAKAAYELYPHVALDDGFVGQENAAPPGELPWWVSTTWLSLPHAAAALDPRIRADIARRLRGESPCASLPRAEFP